MANDIIEQNRQIGQNFFNFLMRGGDPNQVFSPDFVYHDAQGVSHDLAGTMALIQPILVANGTHSADLSRHSGSRGRGRGGDHHE